LFRPLLLSPCVAKVGTATRAEVQQCEPKGLTNAENMSRVFRDRAEVLKTIANFPIIRVRFCPFFTPCDRGEHLMHENLKHKAQSTKYEVRNTKQIENPKHECSKRMRVARHTVQRARACSRFRSLDFRRFEFVSNFGFRASGEDPSGLTPGESSPH